MTHGTLNIKYAGNINTFDHSYTMLNTGYRVSFGSNNVPYYPKYIFNYYLFKNIINNWQDGDINNNTIKQTVDKSTNITPLQNSPIIPDTQLKTIDLNNDETIELYEFMSCVYYI